MVLSAKEIDAVFRQQAEHVFAASPDGAFPKEDLPEVAFAGRSNVGKSSLINSLLGRKKLARTSNTPGATRAIHFYDIGHRFYLVDLPGYGYAKFSKTESDQLIRWVNRYFSERRSLRLVCVLIDARRGVKEADEDLMQALVEIGLQVLVVLTKTDKLKEAEREAVAAKVQQLADDMPGLHPQPVLTSTTKNKGLEDLRQNVLEATLA